MDKTNSSRCYAGLTHVNKRLVYARHYFGLFQKEGKLHNMYMEGKTLYRYLIF